MVEPANRWLQEPAVFLQCFCFFSETKPIVNLNLTEFASLTCCYFGCRVFFCLFVCFFKTFLVWQYRHLVWKHWLPKKALQNLPFKKEKSYILQSVFEVVAVQFGSVGSMRYFSLNFRKKIAKLM